MDNAAACYQLKGMIFDLPSESQAEIKQAKAEIIAIAKRSDNGFLGLCLASAEIGKEGKWPMK